MEDNLLLTDLLMKRLAEFQFFQNIYWFSILILSKGFTIFYSKKREAVSALRFLKCNVMNI